MDLIEEYKKYLEKKHMSLYSIKYYSNLAIRLQKKYTNEQIINTDTTDLLSGICKNAPNTKYRTPINTFREFLEEHYEQQNIH